MIAFNRKTAGETLVIGTMVAQAIHLADELYRLYRFHKPKRKMGFTQAEQKRWYRR